MSPGLITLAVVGTIFFVSWFFGHGNDITTTAPQTSPVIAHAAAPAIFQLSLSLAKPLYTRDGAVLCPLDSFADVSEGRGFTKTVQLLERGPAIEGSHQLDADAQSCEVLHDGVEVHTDTSTIEDVLSLPGSQIPALSKLLRKRGWLGLGVVINGDQMLYVTRIEMLRN